MGYGLLFTLLAVYAGFAAFQLGGVGYVLFWPAVSFFSAGLAYLGMGPRVFGKDARGRIPLWSKLFHFPFLASMALLWHVVRLLSRENAYDRVSADLIVGRRLLAGELPDGVANYLDLTAELEAPRAVRRLEGYRCHPIMDGGVPSAAALHATLCDLGPGLTYIHCARGHGRAAVVALALLAQRGAITDTDDGLEKLKSVRPRVRLNARQLAFVREYIVGRNG